MAKSSTHSQRSIIPFNQLSDDQARYHFERACVSDKWIRLMMAERPFSDVDSMLAKAEENWLALDKTEWLKAFSGHPEIGDIDSLRTRFASTSDMTFKEQAGAQDADDATLLALKQWNARYREKFGFVFLICARGLSAEFMLAALKERFNHHLQQELSVAGEEKLKIIKQRLHLAVEQCAKEVNT
ncbi:2-oxo-4-hydroxy-4-carboxy-5-ureidoimidazoline decarboxylase [Aestuariibacter sp. AA17]|uniref:2-oxo-4-hydroxy-4-carboxy-5-ureidoimidazoline decarboxylase n=1 Tax=Fluctibacter corallii TaxID=2984329 RepID=A0ABT3A6C2_9ALTE|nr:2-oxo-4-hydroxy-4-carboxy-5-ureidoimidazoline decarboxylase [Aestuariibacter sp. AA17]MCV2884231.1 2-oxo-4-hydroxy-4-carboxy-5-ureidoimidazoline decarboxylase [Aestuariibacter sp. AA17]